MQNNLQLKNRFGQASRGSILAEGLLHRWLYRSPGRQKGLMLLVFCLLPLFNLQAATTYIWTGGGADTKWTTAANWSTGTVPSNAVGSTDIIQFNSTVTVIALPAPTYIGQLILSGSANVTLSTLSSTANATFTLFGTNGDDLVIPLGTTLSLTSGSSFTLTLGYAGGTTEKIDGIVNVGASTTFNASNGTATITGTINNSGTVTAASGTGSVTVTGTINNNSGGTFTATGTAAIVNVTGGTFNNSSTVTVTGTATNLKFTSGGVYNHNLNGVTVPTLGYDINSTVIISGQSGSTALPTFPATIGGNLTWSSPLQTLSGSVVPNLKNVNGNFTITAFGAGGGITLSTPFVVGGNFRQDAGTVVLGQITTVTGNLTLNGGTLTQGTSSTTINGDLNQSGGTLIQVATTNVAGNLNQSGGTLNLNNSTSTAATTLNLKKDLIQTGATGKITRNASGTGAATIVFNGTTSTQNVTFITGGVTNAVSYTVSNSNYGIGLTGAMPVNAGATLTITNSGSPFSGTGNITYSSANTTLVYNGTAPQTATAFEFPTTSGPANLTINNNFTYPQNIVTLSGNIDRTISSNLVLTSGFLAMGDNNLTVGAIASTDYSGTYNNTGGAVNGRFIIQNGLGRLNRIVPTAVPVDIYFPIGFNDGTTVEYLGCSFNFTANSVQRTITAGVYSGPHPQYDNSGPQTNYLKRYWSFSDNQAGSYTYSASFSTYFPSNYAGTTANLRVNRWDIASSTWSEVTGLFTNNPAVTPLLNISAGNTRVTCPIGGSEFTGRVEPVSDYEWIGGPSGDYTVAGNWGPTPRTTPMDYDILRFKSGGNVTVTNVPTQKIGQLILSNNTAVSLEPASASTLTILGLGGTDLDIPDGSSLTLAGAGTNSMSLAFSGIGTNDVSIAGALNINSNDAQSNTVNLTNSVATVAPTGIINNAGTISGATTTTLLMLPSATYNHNRDGGIIPTANYDATSNVNVTGITATMPTSIPASLGNLNWNSTGQTIVDGSITTLATLNGNFTITSTGPAGSIVLPATFTVTGNLNQDGGILNLNSSTAATTSTLTLMKALKQTAGSITRNSSGTGAATIVFNGGSTQAVTFAASGVTNGVSYTINNTGGVTLNGTMLVNGGGTLTIMNAGSGAIGGTGTVAYSGNSTLAYGSAQTASDKEFPATNGPSNLTISNTVTLGALTGDRSLAGVLTLSSGLLKLGANNLTIGSAGSISGTPSVSKMIVQNGSGQLKKTFAASVPSSFTFPIGEETGPAYLPVSLIFTANSLPRTIGVTMTNTAHPSWNSNGTPNDYLNRYWTFSDSEPGGTYSYTGTFTYNSALAPAGDVNGTAGNIRVNRWDGSNWIQLASTSASNVLTISTSQSETSCKLGGNSFTGRVNPANQYTWNGSISSDWFNPANWDQNGIPSGTDNVIINNASAPHQPTVSTGASVSVNNLDLSNNVLTLGANAGITVGGTFNYDASTAGTAFHSTSTFTYANPNTQTIYALDYGNLVCTGTGTSTRSLADGNINIYGIFTTTGTGTYTPGSNSSVNFIGTGTITIPAINYNNLNISGARDANNVTLANGTINVAGSFTSTATFTGTGAFVPGGTSSKVVLSSTSPQTIPAINYYSLDATGGPRTLPAGPVKIAGAFTTGTAKYTVMSGSSVEFNGTANQTIPVLPSGSDNYYNLAVSGTGANNYALGTAAGGSMTIDGNFTQTTQSGSTGIGGLVQVANFAVNNTITIKGDLNVFGGIFRLINNTGGGATVNVSNVNLTGSGSISMEGASSPSGVAILAVSGNFTSSGSGASGNVMLDFGANTNATGNEVRIGGDLKVSGPGTFTTTTTGTVAPNGVLFNRTASKVATDGPQKIDSTVPHTKTRFTVNGGSSVVLVSNFAMTGVPSTTLNEFIVNSSATLDMAGKTITGGGTTNNYFKVNSLGIVKNSYLAGVNGAITGFGTNRTFDPGASLELYGGAAIAQGTFPASVTNLTISGSNTAVTLGSSIAVSGTATVNSGTTLDLSANQITGTGSFVVNQAALVKTAYASGLGGAVATTTRNFDPGADLELKGSTAVTNSTFPTAVRNLVISNTNAATLGSNIDVSLAATVNSGGKLDLSDKQITGTGNFVVNSTALVKTSNASGLRGGVAVTGTKTFNAGADLELYGGGAINPMFPIGVTAAVRNLTISGSNTAVTLGENIDVSGTATVSTSSILDLSDKQITGTGSFVTTIISQVKTSHPSGLNGAVAVTGTKTFHTLANLELYGTAPIVQSIFPAAVGSLIISNTNAVTLGSDLIVNGTTTVNSGLRFDLGAFKITGTNTKGITINSNVVVRSSRADGLNGAITGFGTRTFNSGSDLELYGGGLITQSTFPTSVNNLTISGSNTAVTLGSGIAVTGTATVSSGSTLDLVANQITGLGNFVVNPTALVKTSHASGLDGAVAVTGTKTFDAGADLEFNGNAAINTTFPTSVRNLTVSNTNKVTLGSSMAVSGIATVNSGSTMDLSDKQINGAGSATIYGTLKTANVEGLSGASNTALANTLSGITLGSASTIEYNGAGAQNISARTDYKNLVVSVADNKTLLGNITVGGELTVSNGVLQTGSKIVTLSGTASIVETETAYVNGTVESTNNMSAAGTSYIFNGIGLKLTPAGPNLPGNTTVSRVTGTHITANGNRGIDRIYTITPAPGQNHDLNVTMEFGYWDHELNGISKANLVVFKSEDGNAPWAPKGGSPGLSPNTVALTGIKDFSVWTLGDNGAPLPVELVSFEAEKNGSNVDVNWTTAVEKNSQGFEVQVSANGKEFHKLGFVESHNGNSLQQYHFTDLENGKTGIRYYRLKQVDLDGTVTYYGPKTVRFEAGKFQLNVYPNPFEREVNLDITALESGKATLKLSDLTGKTVFAQEVHVQKGNNKLTIGLDESLSAGVYLLQTQIGSEQITTRLLKH